MKFKQYGYAEKKIEVRKMTMSETITSGQHTFELVDFVPYGYKIWNIGKNMIDGYLPLCRLSPIQPFAGGRNIEVGTLKAIKIDGAQTILAAIGNGQGTIEEMEQYLKRYKNAKAGTWSFSQVQKIKKALPFMRQIKWN